MEHTIIIDKNEEVNVLASIDSDVLSVSEIIFQPYKDKLSEIGILAANSIAFVSRGGRIPIRLYNTTDDKITVYKGTKLGYVEIPDILEVEQNKTLKTLNSKTEFNHIQVIIDDIEKDVINKINVNDKKTIINIIKNFSDAFSKNKMDIGCCPLIKHNIDVTNERPIAQNWRRAPLHLENKVDEMIVELEKNGIIRESVSPWSSPIVICQKKSGEIRLCIDYRKLNSVTRRPIHPIPDNRQLFDSLAGAKYFSALDLSSGYYNIEISENDKEKTAFATRRGQFEFNRMPFGLCGAPATFQRLMHIILREENFEKCLIYLDDILIYGSSMEEHNKRLKDILDKITKAGVKLSPGKCYFLKRSIKYLGHIISNKGVETDPDKIKAVAEWPIPLTNTDLQSFLGFCNYYRRYIKQYSEIVEPLEEILKLTNQNNKEKKALLKLNEIHFSAVKKLKVALTSAPILVFPIKDELFILDTDASHFAMGAVLSQIQNGQEKVISYGSKKFTKAEKMYCVTRKELLAVYHFTKQYKHYLMGKKFVIRTDHRSLTWMLNWRSPNTSQYCSWIAELSMFDFEIQYRPGKLHENADALSRGAQCGQCDLIHEEPKKKRNIKVVETIDEREGTVQIQRQINEVPIENNIENNSEDNQLEYSENRRQGIIKYFHNRLGHPNSEQTALNIQRYHNWKTLKTEVESFISNCRPCAERKQGNQLGRNLVGKFSASAPFETVCVDITGPLPQVEGYSYILGIIDVYSRYVSLIPIRDISAKTISENLIVRWISYFGIPKVLHSDNGTQFRSTIMRELCQRLGVKQSFSAPYYHQGNGLVERIFRTAKDKLYATCKSNNQSWPQAIPYVEMCMRSSKHNKYKTSPFEILFGERMNLNPELIEGNIDIEETDFLKHIKQRLDIQKIQREKMKKYSKTSSSKLKTNEPEMKLKIGDLVMVKTEERGMLTARFNGPWKVSKILINNNILVENDGKKIERNIHQLKRFHGNVERSKYSTESIISDSTGSKKVHQTPNIREFEENQTRRYPARVHKPNPRYMNT